MKLAMKRNLTSFALSALLLSGVLLVPAALGQTPTLASLSPNSAAVGGPGFTLTVNGASFVTGLFSTSSVLWNGAALATSFVSANQLNAFVPASLISAQGSANITVVNPSEATSNSLTFTITPGSAQLGLSSLSPTSTTPGGPAFTLTVNGSGFQYGSVVQWNGSGLSTSYVSANQLTAFVPTNLIASQGNANITVVNPGGAVSGSLTFPIGGAAGLTLSSLSPNFAIETSSAFTLTVNGSGFQNGALVLFNNVELTTSYVSTSQLTALVPANAIVYQGFPTVTVMNPSGAFSNTLIFTIGSYNSAMLSSLSPSSAVTGGPAFTLTVNGSNFQSGATVDWNGSGLSTSYVSASQLTALVPNNLISSQGSANVTVMNPGGALSISLAFTIGTATAPTLSSLSPSSAVAGGPAFTLTVNGSNFQSGAAVQWNGSAISTNYVSANQLTAVVPNNLIASQGSANVTVINPGGVPSNSLAFAIATVAAPALSSLSPSFAVAGGSAFTLTVNGSNFQSGAAVQWNGAALLTGYVSANQLSAFVPTNLIASQGGSNVTVMNPGGALSNSLAFTIAAVAAPTLSNLSPNFAVAGGPAFTLTLSGFNFQSGAVVLWNGAALSTGFSSGNQLSAFVPAGLIASQGSASVTVLNPNGASSNRLNLTINPPTASGPTLFGVSPNSTVAGGPGVTLTVAGSGFLNGAVVQWNGTALATSFSGSSTQLTASLPSSLTAIGGTFNITVANPNGPESNPLPFSVFSYTSALRIAQIADGASWETQFQIVNLDVVPVNYSFRFWDDNGNPLPLPFVNGAAGTFSGTLAVGATAFAQTPGTAAVLTEGWAEAASSGRIGVLTIFTQSVPGRPDSEGTVTGVESGSRIFMPFDDTNGYVTGVAVANTNPTQALFISMTFQLENGTQMTGSLSLPAHAHTSFVLTTMFPSLAGVRGSIEFTAQTPDIAVVGLRFSPTNSFTSLGEFQ
jgi:alpha-D-ribose 1-methylphosphonate 5-triphosphate synthase subunit PhnH